MNITRGMLDYANGRAFFKLDNLFGGDKLLGWFHFFVPVFCKYFIKNQMHQRRHHESNEYKVFALNLKNP